MTGNQAVTYSLAQLRLFSTTCFNCMWAARMKMTARGRIQGRRNLTLNRFESTTSRIYLGDLGK